MSELNSLIPDYAKDARLNLGSLFQAQSGLLTTEQFNLVVLSVAYALKNKTLIEALNTKITASEHVVSTAKTAATLMAMNNVYYRFVHLVSDQSFSTMKAGLRMNGMATHGMPVIDFELSSLAVSAINGCGLCMDSHVKALQKHGVSNETIQQSVKIAAILHSVAQVLSIEE